MTKDKKNKLLILIMIIILVSLLILIISKAIYKKEADKKEEKNNNNVSDVNETLESAKKNVYGDYVNYPIDLDEDGDTTDDWKIFYKDDERVYLIAADYLQTDSKYLEMTKVEMSKNGECAAFWKTSPTGYDEFDLVNFRCVQTLLDKENWTKFVESKCAEYALGTPTLELWTKSWNEKYKNEKIVEFDMNEKGYYLGTNEAKPDYTMDLSKTDGYKDKLYYPHSTVFKMCTGYWLASPSANKKYNLMRITYNGMIGNDDYTLNTSALRPVVALKTGITAELNEDTGIWELIRKK